MDKFFAKSVEVRIQSRVSVNYSHHLVKVLLQNLKTKLFFKEPGNWTADVEIARDFPNSLNAINFCNANGLKEVQVLLKFKQERYDVALPLLHHRDPQ